MRDDYDFSRSIQNPYSKKLKKQITIRIDEDTIEFFKNMAEDKGIPYQSLINLYLRGLRNISAETLFSKRIKPSCLTILFCDSRDLVLSEW